MFHLIFIIFLYIFNLIFFVIFLQKNYFVIDQNIELLKDSRNHDNIEELNNNNHHQGANNVELEYLANRVNKKNFIPFVTGDLNSITIVNICKHIDFSKLLKGPKEYYNDIDIPIDTIMAIKIMQIITSGREEKTVNHYKQ